MPLVERHLETAEIAAAVRAAAAGRGGLVVVEGPAGIGKTRLLEELAGGAEAEGLEVLRAVAFAAERDFPFGVTRQLFERCVRAAAVAGAEWSPAAAAALGALGGAGAGPARPPAGEEPFAVLHGLYWLCAELASRGPLVLVVDDLQWTDEPSCRFLAHLARRVDDLPVLLAVAVRSGEPDRHGEILDAMGSAAGTRRLRPSPLTAEAVGALVAGAVGDADPQLVAACLAATGGNPFLLHHLLADLPASGPERLRALRAPPSLVRSVDARLAGLAPGSRALARAVAVLGADAGAGAEHCTALAGLGPDQAAAVLDALVAAEILVDGVPLRFVHPLVHEAVSSSAGPGEHRVLHGRAAALLHERGAPAERVAAHLVRAEPGGHPWAAGVLREAATAALTSAAPLVAVSLLRRALAEPASEDRSAVLAELGRAEARAGDPDAEGSLRRALGALGDPRARGDTVLELARLLFAQGRQVEAVEALTGAIEQLGDEAPELASALESQLLNAARVDLHMRHLVRERLAAPASWSRGVPEEHRLVHLTTEATMAGQPASHAAALARRALAGGRLLDRVVEDPLEVLLAARVLAVCGCLDESRALYTHVLERSTERGAGVTTTLFAVTLRSEAAYRAGAALEALADAELAQRLLENLADCFLRPLVASVTMEPLVDRGEPDRAAGLVDGWPLTGSLPPLYPWNPFLWSRGGLRLAGGDVEGAVTDLVECGRREEAWGERNPAVIPWRSRLALALHRCGEVDEARRLAADELDLARRFGALPAVGIALRASGLVAVGDGGVALLEEAVTTLAPSGARLEHARALVDLGAALRRQGRRRAAADFLREGIGLAHDCGATAVVQRGREELAAAGGRPRRLATRGLAALTPSELRVARLAAGGASNVHIAQQLFVSVRCVEVHLSSAYRKLGVAGRAELRSVPGLSE